jgi:hypothetical protein
MFVIPVVVVAVGMWESPQAISKVCGKRGKTVSSFFHAFQQTVISTASSGRR